jgi:hypothetical protein
MDKGVNRESETLFWTASRQSASNIAQTVFKTDMANVSLATIRDVTVLANATHTHKRNSETMLWSYMSILK